MPEFDLMKAITESKTKLNLGNVVVALIDIEGEENAAGYAKNVNLAPWEVQNFKWMTPYPTYWLRRESEARNMIENAISSDTEAGNEAKISAVLVGYGVLYMLLGEGLLVDKRIDLDNGQYIGRILVLGHVWKLIIEIDNKILPNPFSVATVDSDLQIIE